MNLDVGHRHEHQPQDQLATENQPQHQERHSSGMARTATNDTGQQRDVGRQGQESRESDVTGHDLGEGHPSQHNGHQRERKLHDQQQGRAELSAGRLAQQHRQRTDTGQHQESQRAFLLLLGDRRGKETDRCQHDQGEIQPQDVAEEKQAGSAERETADVGDDQAAQDQSGKEHPEQVRRHASGISPHRPVEHRCRASGHQSTPPLVNERNASLSRLRSRTNASTTVPCWTSVASSSLKLVSVVRHTTCHAAEDSNDTTSTTPW